MTSTNQAEIRIWKLSPLAMASIVGALALMIAIFYDGLSYMVGMWDSKEEYSYGYMLPMITLFLIWQRKEILERMPFEGSWAGFLVVLAGLVLFLMGNLSTLYIVVQYAFLVVLAGAALSFMGWRGFKVIWVPLLLLAFMIPLPNFLYQGLSSQLQLLSSQIGVGFIRLFGISVFLEGNVIDLGGFKLQVVEACSGLRYLFPLMTLGFVAAYFYKGTFWKRAVIFLSTIPITVLMNSLRIGAIGVTVEYWGQSMAEGFLHDFEGWAMFMVSTAVLVVEMWVLAKMGKEARPLREVFGLDFPEPPPKNAQVQNYRISKPFVGAALLLVLVAGLSSATPERVEVPPQRADFSTFPLQIGEWQGKGDRMEQIYIDVLKFDDYIIVDFVNSNQQAVNFYVAYYASQRKGESAHSPRSCIPGGGWEITSLTQQEIEGVTVAGQPLRVNRTVIQKGDVKQVVYYWFQQRGRVITNEYLVKWFLFWDAFTRNRTDGSLVRLTAFVKPGDSLEAADKRLAAFAKASTPKLSAFVPE